MDGDDDEVLEALDRLMVRLDDVETHLAHIRRRADRIRAERLAGRSYAAIVRAEDRPLIVELVSEILDGLHDAGARFRRAEARALHREGLSMERIAELFGVTRQRVSALLRPRSEA